MINNCFFPRSTGFKGSTVTEPVAICKKKGSLPQNVMSVPYMNGIKNTRNHSVSK